MHCIEIIDVPAGQAPDWVRRAWVGLVLPLDPLNPFVDGGFCKGVMDGAYVSDGGYAVDAVSVVEILEQKSPEAAEWWRTNTNWIRPRLQLVFCPEACQPIESLPGILPPSDDGQITLERLLDLLCPSEFDLVETETISKPVEGYVICACGPNWHNARVSPINRILVKAMANAIATEYAKVLLFCTDKNEYKLDQNEGHYVLQRLHRLAVEHGIEVQIEEIDHPLDMLDHALRSGIIEEVDGGLALTEKGERLAKEAQFKAQAPYN